MKSNRKTKQNKPNNNKNKNKKTKKMHILTKKEINNSFNVKPFHCANTDSYDHFFYSLYPQNLE